MCGIVQAVFTAQKYEHRVHKISDGVYKKFRDNPVKPLNNAVSFLIESGYNKGTPLLTWNMVAQKPLTALEWRLYRGFPRLWGYI